MKNTSISSIYINQDNQGAVLKLVITGIAECYQLLYLIFPFKVRKQKDWYGLENWHGNYFL